MLEQETPKNLWQTDKQTNKQTMCFETVTNVNSASRKNGDEHGEGLQKQQQFLANLKQKLLKIGVLLTSFCF